MALLVALIALGLLAAGGGGSAKSDEGHQAPPVADFSHVSGASLYASRDQLERGWRTDFSRHIVPLSEFRRGSPGRDGIPPIYRPRIVPVRDVDFLPPDEPVVELVVGGKARAYPFGALVRHEIVNDRVAGIPVVVTFCPLCNTALAFDRRVRGRTLSFGTTGSLRNADLVMYDRQTESWWQQFGGGGLVGRYAGARLRRLPSRGVLWSEFRIDHPEGLLVTSRTGFDIPYGKNPYLGYLDPSRPPPFAVANAGDTRLPPSERVVFVEHRGQAVAVPFSLLAEKRRLAIRVGGRRFIVRLNGRTADVRDEQGRLRSFSEPFWFVAAAFRPDVRVIR